MPRSLPVAVCLGAGYGGRTLMGVVRSLGRRHVEVAAFSSQTDSPARFSHYCVHHLAPSPSENASALEAQLIDFARNRTPIRPVLMPVSDGDLAFVAERLERLAPYFRIHIPPAPALTALATKRAQYETALRLGLDIPRTYFDLSSKDVVATSIDYPVVIKPSVSASWPLGRCKGQIANNAAELTALLSPLEIAAARVVVQSVVPGPASDYFRVNAYIDRRGHPQVWGSLRKYRQYPAGFGLGSLVESIAMPDLESRSLRFLENLGFTGTAGIEFKRDMRDGIFRMIEINPRFELQNHLSAVAGADLAWAMYRDLAEIPPEPRPPYRTGIRWIATNLDVKACLELRRRGELQFRDWLRSIAAVRTASLLTWDDPLPAAWAAISPVLNKFRPGTQPVIPSKLQGVQ